MVRSWICWGTQLTDLWREVVEIKFRRKSFTQSTATKSLARESSVATSSVATFGVPTGDSQAMAIRTLVDRDVRSRSFHNLLEEMAQRCSLLSRDRFRTRNGLIAERGLAEGAFADFDLMAGDPEAATFQLPSSTTIRIS